jgi:hypothetical protein
MTAAVGSIARAAQVLDVLADHPDGAALTEIAARTALTKSSAHRVLSALAIGGIRHPGPRVAGLSSGRAAGAAVAARGPDRHRGRRAARHGAAGDGHRRHRLPVHPRRSLRRLRGTHRWRLSDPDADARPGRPAAAGRRRGRARALRRDAAETRARVSARINAGWLSEYGSTTRNSSAEGEADRRGYAWNCGNVVAAMSAAGLPSSRARDAW